MNDNEFYTAIDSLEYFSPDYMFKLGDHIVCGLMIDCEDEVPHMYFRQFRYAWEYDYDDIREPTYVELAYLSRGIRDLPNTPRHDNPILDKAMGEIQDALMKHHSARNK